MGACSSNKNFFTANSVKPDDKLKEGGSHVVILHGHLIRGEGGSTFCSNVAKVWAHQGHAVTVICNDQNAKNYPFVNEYFDPEIPLPINPPPDGTIRVVCPKIGDILPAIEPVADSHYKKVKPMGECSEMEIAHYIQQWVNTLKDVSKQQVQMVLANHLLLSPVIARNALEGTKIPYNVVVHGNSITHVIKPFPRFLSYAIEGLQCCSRIIASTASQKKTFIQMLKIAKKENILEINQQPFLKKLTTIPKGFDEKMFRVCEDLDAVQTQFLSSFKSTIAQGKLPEGRDASKLEIPDYNSFNLSQELNQLASSYNQKGYDVDFLDNFKLIKPGDLVILFYGHFQNSKGCGELLTAFPKILQDFPTAKLILVGFGPFREHMQGMLRGFKSGNIDEFYAYASASTKYQGEQFIDGTKKNVSYLFRKLSNQELNRIVITGPLAHHNVAQLYSLATVVVIPSKSEEVFNIVAVEAMASGVMPLCHDHSALLDVINVVRKIDSQLGELMVIPAMKGGAFKHADGEVLLTTLPHMISNIFRHLFPDDNYELYEYKKFVGQKLRNIAFDHFSWNKVGMELLRTESEEQNGFSQNGGSHHFEE